MFILGMITTGFIFYLISLFKMPADDAAGFAEVVYKDLNNEIQYRREFVEAMQELLNKEETAE